MNTKRVMVLGLDGASFDIIMPGIKEGILPTFEKLIDQSTYGNLESVIPLISPTAWTSFLTGKNPGKHGIFDFFKRKEESYARRLIDARDIPSKCIHEILSENGKFVGMLNVSMTYPPKRINGFIVTGMLSPPKCRYTYPLSLQCELESLGYRVEIGHPYRPGHEDVYFENLVGITKKRRDALFYLMSKFRWDFLMCVIRGTDIISHNFWRFQDPQHPQYNDILSMRHGEKILEYYGVIDNILNELLHKIGKDTSLIIMSDHGHGREKKVVHLANWLVQYNYLQFKENFKSKLKKYLFYHGFTPDNAWEFIINKAYPLLKLMKNTDRKDQVTSSVFLSHNDINWSKTVAYTIGSIGSYGLIYINRKGREPNGIVRDGKEYERLRNKIKVDITRLKDEESKEEIVDTVYKKEDIYWGDFLDVAPDLIIQWKKLEYVTYLYLTGGGKIVTNNPSTRSAFHRKNGIFIAKGPNIEEGKRIKNASILDLTPLILHMFNLPIPRDMDGRVLKEIFKENSPPAKRNIVYQDVYTDKDVIKPRSRVSNDDEKKIMKRLKSLGYLD